MIQWTRSALIKCSEMSDHVDECLSSGIGMRLSSSILRHKTSDTLFILGSGPSINLITDNLVLY